MSIEPLGELTEWSLDELIAALSVLSWDIKRLAIEIRQRLEHKDE